VKRKDGVNSAAKAMGQGLVACSVASAHRSLGHAQPFEHDRAARDVDNAPRILAIKDGLPGILRSDGDVLADSKLRGPRIGAIGELEDVASAGGVECGLQRPCPRRDGRRWWR
jgi:hypothetical protein